MSPKTGWVACFSLALLAACQKTDVSSPNSTASPSVAAAQGGSDSATSTPNTGGPVAGLLIRIDQPRGGNVQPGDSLGFLAELKDAAGSVLSGRQVGWESSNEAVVDLEWSSGNFAIARARAVGTATVTARSEGKSASVQVTVQ